MAKTIEKYQFKEATIPLLWSGWDEAGECAHTYYDCKFTEDFGPFKADVHYDMVFVDYGAGVIQSFSNDGDSVELEAKFIAKII